MLAQPTAGMAKKWLRFTDCKDCSIASNLAQAYLQVSEQLGKEAAFRRAVEVLFIKYILCKCASIAACQGMEFEVRIPLELCQHLCFCNLAAKDVPVPRRIKISELVHLKFLDCASHD